MRLKPKYSALAEFDASHARRELHADDCIISYGYRTHPSTARGGWARATPEPDPDGVWFYVGAWDPEGPERHSQIDTQAGFSTYRFGRQHLTVLIKDCQKQPLRGALWKVLRRHGVEQLVY
ncbi:MAG: hypothetical protein QM756_33715 [Polyangiaceae bacterium]